jgi:hypothetical protein
MMKTDTRLNFIDEKPRAQARTTRATFPAIFVLDSVAIPDSSPRWNNCEKARVQPAAMPRMARHCLKFLIE